MAAAVHSRCDAARLSHINHRRHIFRWRGVARAVPTP
jgi:hypothetical protein